MLFLFRTLHSLREVSRERKEIINQISVIGVESLPVVSLMALFSGMVLGLQAGHELLKFQFQEALGAVVAASLTRELGPVLTGLIVAGRAGAAMAAEIGTMKVSEEIDALRAMAINPYRYLVLPRMVAALITLPLLTIFTDVIGIMGGFIIGRVQLNVRFFLYLEWIVKFVTLKDVWSGVIKSFGFGGIIAIISCYEGFSAESGARGVGKATTQAVVISFILILIADYFVTHLLY